MTVLCKMNILGICAVFCILIIYAVDVCDAECDEYFVVFEEITCSSHVMIKPLKRRDKHWDKVQGYPCNSTDKNHGKKKCFVEFDCLGSQGSCPYHIKQVNHQTHSFIDNQTLKPITRTTEALVVPKSNITVEKKPNQTVDEEFNTSTYDLNLIYVNDNVILNSSLTSTMNCTLYCDYAETICIDRGKPENYRLSDVENVHALEIAINRDETSPIQPLFTGYFPESSNDSSTNYKNNFTKFKTATLLCPTLKYNNCKLNLENKTSKQINVYIKTNCIENNTITKYPDCTKNSITSENVLNLKCEHILFAKHNPQIVQTPPTPPPKQELSTWNCQIIELNTFSSKEQRSENSKIHFINCSSEPYILVSNNKNKNINVTPISNGKTLSINNTLTKPSIKQNKTEMSTRKDEINIDPSSPKNPENIITILITEKAINCSDKSYFKINEGKIVDLGNNNNKEKILQNHNVELILTNCINVTFSTISETQPHQLSIILKNESLNNSNLKQFNGTSKDESVKRRILLRCDHRNLDLSSNFTSTSNKTVLQCESIDLDLYNITGIEITPLSQTANIKTAIGSQNKAKQELLTWNCKIVDLNDTLSSKEQHREKSKLYFKNCVSDGSVNKSKNKFWNTEKPFSDGKNRTNESITTIIDTTDGKKYIINRNNTEMPSGKREMNKDNLSHINPEYMIKIALTEKANNCSNTNIDEGKIIDLRANNNEKQSLQNNIIELKLSGCIDINSSINNETQPDSTVELTIILKSESLNGSNLKQFNGTAKVGSVKQRILLRCDHPYLDSSNNTSSNTVLQCETLDLDLYNITGIEISTNVSPANNTKEKKKENLKMVEENHNQIKANKNNILFTNKTVEMNESNVNNKSNENNTKVVRNKEIQKKISESKERSKTLNFNRKKDIPNGAGQNSLALGSPETEKILLITLLTVASVAILIVIALKACPKKREYNPAPTREPPDEEETAF